jgi:hypothetical protein
VTLTAAAIEAKFSSDTGKARFPEFCNSIIALEAPRTSTFPNLASKAEPDGGIDGQWNSEDLPVEQNCCVARSGWNVYQFKTVDVVSLGREKAFHQLCNRAKGAIADVIGRLDVPVPPSLYVLFTNLQLGIDRPGRARGNRSLNAKTKKLRDALLRGAPAGVDVEIFDAGKIEGMVARHRALRLILTERAALTWEEARRRELNQWQIDAPLKGREVDLKQLDAWLSDDAVRVIALTGPNSIGKTRLTHEGTRSISPATFFVDNISGLISDGIETLATGDRPITVVVEDPSRDNAEQLARQALGSNQLIKLIMTIPSKREIPATVFGDSTRVKTRHIGPLNSENARQLLDATASDIDSRARDWVLLQAAGNPGVILAAAREGKNIRRSADNLRARLAQSFGQRIQKRFGSEALTAASVVSPLVYVRLDSSAELHVLIDALASGQSEANLRHQIAELESFGCIRIRDQTASLTPPIFAAGLLRELIAQNPDLPSDLFDKLDHDGRKRLLERLVTLELPDNSPFWNKLLSLRTDAAVSAELNEQLELLDYLARAAPRVVTSFLRRELDDVVRLIHTAGRGENLDRLGLIVDELLDDVEAGSAAFEILSRLAVHNATHDNRRGIAQSFRECFVFWYPHPFSYSQREAALEKLLASDVTDVRLLAASAIVIATDIPRSLSGRAVQARRLGTEPTFGTMRECWEFLMRAMEKRLALCQSDDGKIKEAALAKLADACGPLAEALPGEQNMQLLRKLMALHFDGSISVDTRDLWIQLKWIRNRYTEIRDRALEKWENFWSTAIAELEGWIDRLTSGSFSDRLRLALGPTFDFEEVEFEGRKIYSPELRVIHLAREAATSPEVMTNAWDLLIGDRPQNVYEFVLELGRCDVDRKHFRALLERADTWQWAQLLGGYLSGAQEVDPAWVENRLSEFPVIRGDSNVAGLLAIQRTGLNKRNRERLQALLRAKSVKPEDVARAFSVGRWLEPLPPYEVKQIFEYIETEPKIASWLADVISLYLHPHKALALELLPVARRTLTAVQEINDGHGNLSYHCDQIAMGIARTDINVGFAILEELLERISKQDHWRFYTGWSPFAWIGSRDFWEFVRTQQPERTYSILGSLGTKCRRLDLRHHQERHLLDLANHRQVLRRLADEDLAAAHVFADCLISSQPEFLQFATDLLALYPNDNKILSSLNSAVLEKTGRGSVYNHLADAEKFVEEHLSAETISPNLARWRQSLVRLIQDRRSEERSFLRSDPLYWEI